MSSPLVGNAQVEAAVFVDTDLSIAAGARTVDAAYTGITRLVSPIIPSRLSEEESLIARIGGAFYRLVRVGYFDLPLAEYHEVIGHEVFGHGSRAREFNYSASYQLPLPQPYGRGGGSTSIPADSPASDQDLITLFLGGIESAAVGSDLIENRWARSGVGSLSEAVRYFNAHTSVFDNIRASGSSDGALYSALVNRAYLADRDGASFRKSTINDRAIANLLNPWFLLSAYRVLIDFPLNGTERFEWPMLESSGVPFIAWPRYVLTPFGPEWGLETLVKLDRTLLQVEARIGDGLGASTWFAEVDLDPIVENGRWRTSIRTSVWNQPGYDLLHDGLETIDGGLGGAVLMRTEIALRQGSRFRLLAEIGYKTAGFREGEQIDGSAILRLGGGLVPPIP